jgi:hypothetical protein
VATGRGQGTVEWIGLVLLVLLLFLGLLALGGRLPAGALARTMAARLICAAGISDACGVEPELVAAYGAELAEQVEGNAPKIIYEAGMTALPVDFRSCRWARCGNGPDSGSVWTSDTGEPAAAFVHTVDCRSASARAASRTRGDDCSGDRRGNLYIQYFLYYEDSTSLKDVPGNVGFHQDDWESYQVRIGQNGTEARASSHHGYNYKGGLGSWASDAGLVHRSAWGRSLGHTYVSGGSHAGHVYEPPPVSAVRGIRLTSQVPARRRPPRWTPGDRLELIPIETLDPTSRHTRFAIVPPWRKPVYRDPESEGT